jgi:uncharacterized integral membrane protein
LNAPKLIAGLILAAALVVFGGQNTQSVTFHFLVFKLSSVPMVLALFAAALLGVILGWIVSAPGRIRRMRERRALKDQIESHEQVEADAKPHSLDG